MRTLRRFLFLGLMLFSIAACFNDTHTVDSDKNDESVTSDSVLEDTEEGPTSEVTEDVNAEPSSDNIQNEESKEDILQEKYEKRQWAAEQEGITYKMTVDFTNEKEGTFDWLVTEGNTENPLEDVKDIPFTVDTVNPDGDVVAYYQYEDELDSALVEGQLKFQENSIEFARYRFVITLK